MKLGASSGALLACVCLSSSGVGAIDVPNIFVIDSGDPDNVIGGNVNNPIDEEFSKGPMQIGSHHNFVISSADDMTELKPAVSLDGKTATYKLYHENASYLSIHFSNIDLPPGCSLKISDANGEQSSTMQGKGKFDLESFWGRHVNGDTMIIRLHCNSRLDAEDSIFDIDDYVAGYPKKGNGSRKNRNLLRGTSDEYRDLSICEADDKRNAICYKDSHATEYDRARAVARLWIKGSGACTGWLVSGSSMLITNQHCIDSLEDVQNTDFEFMGEEAECTNVPGDGSWMSDRGDIYTGSKLLAVSAQWDYALIQLDGFPADKYGYLELDNRQATVDEEIYIPQHPGARPKELGIFDTFQGGNCKVMGFRPGCSPEDMQYSCDTEAGSSGSPVLARSSHKVIALHHCGGGCNGNLGAPVNRFYDDMAPYLPGCQNDSDCDDGDACTLDVCDSAAGHASCLHTPSCPPPTTSPTTTPPTLAPGMSEFLTTMNQNNGSWGNIFQIEAKQDLMIMGFDIHTGRTSQYPVAVWTRAGPQVFHNADGQWTMIQEAPTVTGKGRGKRTALPLLDEFIHMTAGETRAFYISGTARPGLRYTIGKSEGGVFSQNSDLIFFEGRGVSTYPFSKATFSPRVWNGYIKYALATPSPTSLPTPSPTPAPTPLPTPSPTLSPTPLPTPAPTPFPTPAPTEHCITYELDLETNTCGFDTYWQIARDLDGMVVAQGSGYDNGVQYIETGCIPDDCYRFTISRDYGDSLGGNETIIGYPLGSYTLKNQGQIMGTGGAFDLEEVVLFGTCANSFQVGAQNTDMAREGTTDRARADHD